MIGTTSAPRIRVSSLIIHAILIFGSILMVGPFLWMLLTSLKSFGESVQVPPVIWPHTLRWANYHDVTTLLPFGSFYFNTVALTIGRTVGQLVFCSLAAYAFARIEFPG